MDLEGQPARDACQRTRRRTLNEDGRFSHFYYPVTIFVKMAFDQRQRSGVQKTVRGVTQNLIGRISTAHRLRIKGDGQGNYSIKGLRGNKQLILFQVRSYNGHYLGLSIRRREFDSPTHRQSFYVSVRRMARQQIANLNNAGSSPVTHSNNIHTYITAGYVSGQTTRLITQKTEVRILHPQPFPFQSSTAVVQLTVNQLVVGSIPASGATLQRSI